MTEIVITNPIRIAITEIGARLRTHPALVDGRTTKPLRNAEEEIRKLSVTLLGPPSAVAGYLWKTAKDKWGITK